MNLPAAVAPATAATGPQSLAEPEHLRGLSLKRQLLLWLLLPQLVLFLVGGALAYRIALNYAEKAIDQSLTQLVRSLARQVKPVGSGLLVDFPKAAQDIIEQDPKDRVSYMVSSPPGSFLLGNSRLPDPAPSFVVHTGETLLYNAQVDNKPMRVALLDVNYGDSTAPQRLRVQVAKSLAVQQRLTTELIADMLAPLLLLGAVLSMLVYGGISRGLQPLTRLQAQLGDRRKQVLSDLSPIELTQAPQEVRALATALNQLLSAVRRSLGQEKRFLNDAAHQLRTPLAGLISQTELALTETDPAALRDRLTKVLSGARRSAHLVHQLLSLARNEVEVKLRPLDVATLARDVAREWTPRALKAGVDLGFEGADHLSVVGEPLLLREALNNLIDNALTYAGTGSEVTLKVQAQGSQVLLEVADNGPGLSPSDLPRVFERFWRASDLPGGCGLGLAIVAEIALRHGGRAKVSAAQPHGLRVQLLFPLGISVTPE
jgi:two-component system sensor histidine kinase TctE